MNKNKKDENGKLYVEIIDLLPEVKEVLRNILFDYQSVITPSMAKEDIKNAITVFHNLESIEIKMKENKTINLIDEKKTTSLNGNNQNSHTPIPIEKVKKGDFIRLLDRENAPVYTRGEYSTLDWPRGKGRYECSSYDDISKARYLPKGTIVYIGFDF